MNEDQYGYFKRFLLEMGVTKEDLLDRIEKAVYDAVMDKEGNEEWIELTNEGMESIVQTIIKRLDNIVWFYE